MMDGLGQKRECLFLLNAPFLNCTVIILTTILFEIYSKNIKGLWSVYTMIGPVPKYNQKTLTAVRSARVPSQ